MSAREAMLDAAAAIMLQRGLARATTKEIAREAGYSEAALYKHFADKQELFLGVLKERLPPLAALANQAETGSRSVAANLTDAVTQLLRFYEQSFPIAASIFSERELLAAWRAQLDERGAGPRMPVNGLAGYLTAEKAAGRLPGDRDPVAIASLLAGAAFLEAFLASFHDEPIAEPHALAARLVAAVGIT